MRKFSQLNNINKTSETSDNILDLINNIIKESLTVEDGKILGIEKLATIINKIVELNEKKTSVKVLENVKAASYHSFNIKSINEAIESIKEDIISFSIVVEETVVDDTLEMINESTKTEKKCDKDEEECEDTDEENEENEKIDDIEGADKEEETVVEGLAKEETITTRGFERNVGFVYETEMDKLVNIMESIGDISLDEIKEIDEEKVNHINEHHLTSKKDKLKYISDSLDDTKAKEIIIGYISELPEYIKTSDIDDTLNGLTDKEIDKLYNDIEDISEEGK